ncbi:MAG: hypothetical protein AABZ23_00665 [Deltaproteobacteria bacterium]
MKSFSLKDAVKNRKNSAGASVTAVIVILGLIVIMGVVFASFLSTGLEQSLAEVTSMRALYAAEAGIEAAIGHLKQTPVSSNWVWNAGYSGKSIGSGTVDLEVLEYEMRDGALAAAYACEAFESQIDPVAIPPRTVFITLLWGTTADLTLELYNADVTGSCASPPGANLIASSATTNNPETIRYRITDAPPATLTYTARVTGTAGTAYSLRITHPDESSFSSANQCGQPDGPPFDECMRGLIALGKVGAARREVFMGVER